VKYDLYPVWMWVHQKEGFVRKERPSMDPSNWAQGIVWYEIRDTEGRILDSQYTYESAMKALETVFELDSILQAVRDHARLHPDPNEAPQSEGHP